MSDTPPSKRNWSDLGSRIASAIVLGGICFSMIIIGVGTTEAIAALGCGIMGWEWRRISGSGRVNIWADAAAVGVTAVPSVLTYVLNPLVGWVAALAGIAAVGMLASDKKNYFSRTALGLLAVAIAGVCFVWLRTDFTYGLHIALWLPFTVIAADVGAYFAGRFIGGPKLAPKISPNKTISGAIGGQVAAVVVGTGYALYFGVGTLTVIVLASLVTAIVSQIGDLTESAAKRSYGVKDASALIPGHGGLLDRFDGLIAAILAMALATLIAGSTIFAW